MAGGRGPQGRRHMTVSQAMKAAGSGNLNRVIRMIFGMYGGTLLAVVFFIAVAAVADVRGTLFLRGLIDDYIIPMTKTADPDFGPLFRALRSMALIYLVGAFAGFAYNRLMVQVGQGTMRRIREDLFAHMEKLPISYFDTHAHGDIMSIYTNDTDTLRQFIGQSFPQLINSICSIASVFVSMCILNIPLTLISVSMTFGILFASGKIAAQSGRFFGLQQRHLGEVNGYIEEMMSGQKVIKVFSHEGKSIAEFRRKNEELRTASDKANTMANILMPIVVQLGNLDYVIVAVLGATFAVTGRFGVTIGVLVSFLTLNRNFNRPFSQISMQMNAVAMAAAGADRIYSLMDLEPETDNGYVTLVNARENPDGTLSETKERTGVWAWKHQHQADGSIDYVRLEGDIVMDGVDFGYVPEKMVLHDIRLYADKGQKIAFVGSTGAGKTTITNLINRFYEIQDGKIRYDGMVLQETNLFTGTVMDNIRFGRLEATDEECIAAAKLANADGFIRRLPDGYRTVLRGNGSSLSQGQRQLLAIARAAVADPPVLILDAGPEGNGLPDEGTDHLRHRPPPLYRKKRGLHHGAGAGANRGARQPRRADGTERAVLQTVHRPYGRERLTGL